MLDGLARVPAEFWSVLTAMAPYLLLGFFVAGVLSVLVSPRSIERHLGGRGVMPVFAAAAMGIPLPLCSCGVIPVAASLRRHGAGRGATAAFLISTPQTGVDSIAVTYKMLGGLFAILRPVIALISGIIGGLAVTLLVPDKAGQAKPIANPAPVAKPAGHWLTRMLHYGFITLPADIGRNLLVGLLIASLITALVPAHRLSGLFENQFLAMLVMLAAGVPMYVCATASVPVAMVLMATQNLSPGAALVFLMTGPATNVPTLTTIWRVMGPRTAVVYLVSVAVTALAAGTAMNFLYSRLGVSPHLAMGAHDMDMSPGRLDILATLALLAVLLPSLVQPLWRRLRPDRQGRPAPAGMKLTLAVEGMTCSHCQAAVTRVLQESAGVRRAQVDLNTKQALVEGEALDGQALIAAVGELGYRAHLLPDSPPHCQKCA
jgi:hypothetical protein